MTQLFTNNAESTLSAPISNSATALSVQVGDGAKFPNPGAGDFFLVTLFKVVGALETAWEIVKVTARSGDSFTVTRAQEGTTAISFDAGDGVSLRWTAASSAVFAQKANNLSDLPSAATARTNLGLGTAATTAATDYATAAQGIKADNAAAKANNLSDLANAATARTNLGLGTAATTAASAYATAAQGTKADAALPATGGTMTGTLSAAPTSSVIGDATTTNSKVNIIGASGAGNAAFMGFNRAGAFAAYFGVDTDNEWKVGGWSYGAVSYKLLSEWNTLKHVTHPTSGNLLLDASGAGPAATTKPLEGLRADHIWVGSPGQYGTSNEGGQLWFGDKYNATPMHIDAARGSTLIDPAGAPTMFVAGAIFSVTNHLDAYAVTFGSAVTNKGNSGTAITVDFRVDQYLFMTANNNFTLTVTTPLGVGTFQLEIKQDATGGRIATWPATFKWPGSYSSTDKALSTAANARDLLIMRWNGTDYVCNLIKGIA